jgi:hypothetical protein
MRSAHPHPELRVSFWSRAEGLYRSFNGGHADATLMLAAEWRNDLLNARTSRVFSGS